MASEDIFDGAIGIGALLLPPCNHVARLMSRLNIVDLDRVLGDSPQTVS